MIHTHMHTHKTTHDDTLCQIEFMRCMSHCQIDVVRTSEHHNTRLGLRAVVKRKIASCE